MIKLGDIKNLDLLKDEFEDISLDPEYWFDRNINENEEMSDLELLLYAFNDKKLYQKFLNKLNSEIKTEKRYGEDIDDLLLMKKQLLFLSRKLNLKLK